MKKICILTIAALVFCGFLFPIGFTPVSADEAVSAPIESVESFEEEQPSETVGDSETESEEAESELDGIIPETEMSKWFEEKIVPYIMEYGAAALGVLTGLLVVLGKLKNSIKNLIGAYDALKKSNNDNEETKNNVTAFKAEMKEWQEATEAYMEKRFKEIANSVTDKLDDACDTVHKILNVEEIAYEENPVLVSKGTAKKIAEVIHNGSNEAKNESDDQA